jgi:uncharacterized protein YcfJ
LEAVAPILHQSGADANGAARFRDTGRFVKDCKFSALREVRRVLITVTGLLKETVMKLKTITAITITLASAGAYAASDFVDTAQVVSATPIIERVAEQRQECSPVTAPRKESNIVAPIIGGVVGGLLGHQVGHGSGQTAATIVGAAGGAVAGNMIGDRANNSQPTQQCRTVESMREVVNGYNVTYRYNGRDVNVALPYNPGSTIKVGVGVIVDERAADAGREPARAPERRASRGQAAMPGDPAAPGGYNYRN